ncbi:MAG: PEP-CTERM sorting domain-containing protein [bacterium]
MVASMVQAEILAWRVDLGGANTTFDTAKLFATSESGAGYELTGTVISGPINKFDNTYGLVTYESAVTAGSANNFYVRLYLGGSEVAGGYSALKSWSTLVAEGSLVSGNTPDIPATAWNAVPEPTAMALLAMGVSALLLRRKRAV